MKNKSILRRIIVFVIKYTLYVLFSLLLALLIRIFLCSFFVVASDSMEPTILPGDFILTDKWTYGARIFRQLKFDNDPQIIRMAGLRQINHNDVVAFNFPFRNNWYFVAGDMTMNSQDSRYFGLVPEAYIIGRASLIITSKDINTGKRRWNRMLKSIK